MSAGVWAVWLVTGAAVAALLATLATLRADFRAASPVWKLLAVSGLPLSLGGLGFAVRFWRPTSGPYLANVTYQRHSPGSRGVFRHRLRRHRPRALA